LLSFTGSSKFDEAFQCGAEFVPKCLSGHCPTILDIIPADIRSFYPVRFEETNWNSFASLQQPCVFDSLNQMHKREVSSEKLILHQNAASIDLYYFGTFFTTSDCFNQDKKGEDLK